MMAYMAAFCIMTPLERLCGAANEGNSASSSACMAVLGTQDMLSAASIGEDLSRMILLRLLLCLLMLQEHIQGLT